MNPLVSLKKKLGKQSSALADFNSEKLGFEGLQCVEKHPIGESRGRDSQAVPSGRQLKGSERGARPDLMGLMRQGYR